MPASHSYKPLTNSFKYPVSGAMLNRSDTLLSYWWHCVSSILHRLSSKSLSGNAHLISFGNTIKQLSRTRYLSLSFRRVSRTQLLLTLLLLHWPNHMLAVMVLSQLWVLSFETVRPCVP